jgi:hypothetical protein
MTNERDDQFPDEDIEEEGVDLSPLIEYLKTDKGHELASRIVGIIEDIKKATLEKSSAHAIFEKWVQAGVIVVVVVAASLLSYFGKFETSVGVLFGTLVGYIFGRR